MEGKKLDSKCEKKVDSAYVALSSRCGQTLLPVDDGLSLPPLSLRYNLIWQTLALSRTWPHPTEATTRLLGLRFRVE